jgi:hypothetical protein
MIGAAAGKCRNTHGYAAYRTLGVRDALQLTAPVDVRWKTLWKSGLSRRPPIL